MKHLSILSIAVALLATATVHAQAPTESAKPMASMECPCPNGCMKDGKYIKGRTEACVKAKADCMKKSCCNKMAKECCCGKAMTKDKACCKKMAKAMKSCCKAEKAMSKNCDMGKEKKAHHKAKRFHHQHLRR